MTIEHEAQGSWQGEEPRYRVPRVRLPRRAITAALVASLAMGQAPSIAWAETVASAEADQSLASGVGVPSTAAGESSTSVPASEDGAGRAAGTGASTAADDAIVSSAGSEGTTTPGAPASRGGSSTVAAIDDVAASSGDQAAAVPASGEQVEAATSSAVATDAETFTVSVKVTGVAEHDEGETSVAETWLPLTEVEVAADGETTAWDVFAQALDAAGYSYVVEGWYCPYSITDPRGHTLASTSSEPYCYWSFMLNGDYGSVGASDYVLAAGDRIELVYVDGAGTTTPVGDVETNPDAEHPEMPSDWNGFGNGGGGAVVEGVNTPTENADTAWKDSLLTDDERASMASLAASDPLIINGKIYVVSSSAVYETEPPYAAIKSLARLTVINAATGAREREVTLARTLDSVCRPVYADGILVIPLAGGYLQAVSASTLETLWVVDGTEGAQSISSLTVSDGYVYIATADALGENYLATAGTIRRVNLYTGALAGTTVNETAGYYWAGGIMYNGFYLVGDDAGMVHVFAGDLSHEAASVALGASVRSTLVAHEGFVYAVTTDGVLHKLSVSTDGAASEVARVNFAASSTSTPTMAGGKAFVGGSTTSYTGVLAVVDLASMSLETAVGTYTGATGAEVALPGDVKSVPLVSVQESGTYAYFTCNNLPGGLYCYKLGAEGASMLYTPDAADQNYSMTSAFAGPDGTLYYINDSGNLFALTAHAGENTPDTPGSGTEPGGAEDTPGKPGAGSSGGSLNNHAGGTGSRVPAAHAPLQTVLSATNAPASDAKNNAAADDEDAADTHESEKAADSEVSAAAEDNEAAETENEQAANPAALAGVVAGVVGLAAVVACALWLSRRGGAAR